MTRVEMIHRTRDSFVKMDTFIASILFTTIWSQFENPSETKIVKKSYRQ